MAGKKAASQAKKTIQETDPQAPVWARRANETARAYDAFLTYRDMGVGRSLQKVQQSTNKNTSYVRQLGEWSGVHQWVMRAEAWDAHQQAEREALDARERQDKWEADRRKARDSRRKIITSLARLLGEIIDKDQNEGMDERQLKDLTVAAKNIFTESRLEFGEPTSIEENRMSGILAMKNIDELTDEELARLIQSRR